VYAVSVGADVWNERYKTIVSVAVILTEMISVRPVRCHIRYVVAKVVNVELYGDVLELGCKCAGKHMQRSKLVACMLRKYNTWPPRVR
jgi:hypothetical protein